jgi:SlyX protein
VKIANGKPVKDRPWYCVVRNSMTQLLCALSPAVKQPNAGGRAAGLYMRRREAKRMNQTEALYTRMEALEMRVAYQDRTIEELNNSVTQQWKKIDEFAKKIEDMAVRLQHAEDNKTPGGAEPPPPHY